MVAAVIKLMEGMNANDIKWLANEEELNGQLYVLAPNPTRVIAADHSIPWPVRLLLGAHSRKHVFLNKRPLCLKQAVVASKGMVNRLKWSWFFKDDQREKGSPQLAKREPMPFEGLVPPELDGLAAHLRRAVVSAHKRANSMIATSPSRTPRFVQYAMRWLKNSGLRAVLSDKDGVFVLGSHVLHREMVLKQTLQGSLS